ncbi:aldehyde dehydrogenase (NADP(+)) [Sandaracinobacter sp. RS1-74]|uniref:aldehyde dehydrogenase (NADP(+)) n=1 Tax=Sandaracinobacteroides sayramensis TaxID=2913411 RepID=UPI001EDB1540|nr:aldehyde dehydrogenase (NADP(+)) [Sandaracinobacteroides sayramensis]MCG2839436.1 aldehyde dehydrogenase (NADP(+)) [Sandaracinobacteroides sayramensis]
MLNGDLFIGGERRAAGRRFRAYDPGKGAEIPEPAFAEATALDVADACARAEAAFEAYSSRPLAERAAFLEAVATRIEALGDALLERAQAESGLPLARLQGERGRTCGQLRLFGKEVLEGGWQGLRIDEADAARVPPKPDLRLRHVPLGPVAVFGASNFPLAFSTAGGDTASALAAGCPVVVKGHPAHPGTSELVAIAFEEAIRETGMPAGVFSLLQGASNDIGAALVADPRIAAVGFTGSRAGGTALMRIAAARPVPIPVYAEMSAVNPVVLLPQALKARGAALAQGFVASLTMGAGQFCTNPGLLLALAGPELDAFLADAGGHVSTAPAQVMLSAGIHAAYERGKAELAGSAGMRQVAQGQADSAPNRGAAGLFTMTGAELLADPERAHEIFGATSLVVACADEAELLAVLRALEDQLTATLHADAQDLEAARRLLPTLERKAGRILANGWPTGVEVTHAMVHGGPFPATSDGRSTSVGTLAIERFLRPVCYQDLPEALLPEALRGEGAAGIPLRLNGTRRL